MGRSVVRGAVLALLLAAIVAGQPAAAQPVIPAGTDFWVTRPDGATQFTFPAGDVEALCGMPAGAPITVVLVGVPAPGSDWDSAVTRLNDAVFVGGVAETKVQFRSLAMRSAAPTPTPCGPLVWQARLANVPQPVTSMKIVNSSGGGGTFFAELRLRVELQANRADNHLFVGRLFYDVQLPDPAGGTPWSFGPGGIFRPGMTETNDCIDVLRQKLGMFPPNSEHHYFISDLIAQGKCERVN